MTNAAEQRFTSDDIPELVKAVRDAMSGPARPRKWTFDTILVMADRIAELEAALRKTLECHDFQATPAVTTATAATPTRRERC